MHEEMHDAFLRETLSSALQCLGNVIFTMGQVAETLAGSRQVTWANRSGRSITNIQGSSQFE